MRDFDAIRVGAGVVDRDGDNIGTVEEVGNGYLLVSKGLIFRKDLYIPITEVDSIDREGFVRLSVDKDEIEAMGWDDVPPETMRSETDVTDLPRDGIGDRRDITTETERETLRVPVREEQLRAGTVREEAGEVQVRKNVVEQEQSLEVPVSRDEVDVRRYAVDRPASDADVIGANESIRVPVSAERVVLDKDVRVAEEVEITKRPVTETQRVSEKIRREEVDVEREGDISLSDETTGGTSRRRREPKTR